MQMFGGSSKVWGHVTSLMLSHGPDHGSRVRQRNYYLHVDLGRDLEKAQLLFGRIGLLADTGLPVFTHTSPNYACLLQVKRYNQVEFQAIL